MLKKEVLLSFLILILVSFLGYFYLIKPEIDARKDNVINQEERQKIFKLGLDLVGGSQLVYEADVSKIKPSEVSSAMNSLKETLTRRLNPFGTSEVSIVVENSSVFAENSKPTKKVIIQIPGESDPEKAKAKIGKMPLMEFKIHKINKEGKEVWEKTKLNGGNIKDAQLVYDGQTREPEVQVKFDDKGGKIFADLTKNNVGNKIGIFLDGLLISDPVIREEIPGGTTIISFGNESNSQKLKEASDLARNLRYGALPVPIKSVSSNTISASLGHDILEKGLYAAFYGILAVIIFMIFVYRISGLIASVALISYIVLTLSLFKAFGFVFTAAGIAGFIISIGMAVDANVLIFEMTREKLREGLKLKEAIKEGFARAWLSIRDGNLSSIITAIILFYMTTSLVKGFALTFGIGVITSMFSAIVLTRTFLLAFVNKKTNENKKFKKLLFGKLK